MDHNFVSHAHVMLSKSADSINNITSVTNPATNKLTTGPEELHDVLSSYFQDKFSALKEEPPDDPEVDATMRPQPQISSEWYNGLMMDFTEREIKRLGSSLKTVAAPGHDGISAGIWKILIAGSSQTTRCLALLFSACLKMRYFPALSRHAIIVPILKKASEGRSVKNIRPISLQNSLFKILSKGLASRLATIFAIHPILHPAQEAFLKGGSTAKCIDTLLDVWEDAQTYGNERVTIFYDLAGAYDTVPHDKLLHSLERINLPSDFIQLIKSSLEDCTASVRTQYGLTRKFAVTRSIKQGDPLAPLLFIIFMDPLHCGLERNPVFDHAEDGYEIKNSKSRAVIASSGYADDTTVFSGSIPGAQRMNDFTQRWCRRNKMVLNGMKTELVGCNSGGAPLPPDIIKVDGITVQAVAHDKAIRHLGVKIRFDLNWDPQRSAISSVVSYYGHLATAHKLSPTRCIEFFNVFLLPKIEYGLRFCLPSASQTHKWDQLLSQAFNRCAGTHQRVSHAALEEITGLSLPSTRTITSIISETFVRLNARSRRSTWAVERLPLMNQARSGRHRHNRLFDSIAHVKKLGWTMTKVKRGRAHDFKSNDMLPAEGHNIIVDAPEADCCCFFLIDVTDTPRT